MSRFDRLQAAAETGLDRVDDDVFEDRSPVESGAEPLPPPDGVQAEGYGFHLDDPEADLLDEDLDAGLRDDADADALDVVAEAFNARDLDALLEVVAPDCEASDVLGYDRANLPDAIEELWVKRPTATLTRGRSELEHVGVLWEHDGSSWWPLAVVHVDDVADGTIGVLEVTVDPAMLEQVVAEPPGDDELEEGERWSEWDEGSDGDRGS